MSKITKLRGICLRKKNFVEGCTRVTAMWGSVTLTTPSSGDGEDGEDGEEKARQNLAASIVGAPDCESKAGEKTRDCDHNIDDVGTITVFYKASNQITWDDGGVDDDGLPLPVLDFTYSTDDGVYYSPLPCDGDGDDQQWIRVISLKKAGRT